MPGNSSTPGESSRRRFAAVPIETTYERVRAPQTTRKPTNGPTSVPTPDLTPEGSPSRGPSRALTGYSSKPTTEHVEDPVAHPEPVLRERRRFAPQLIETSRRARRNGDTAPATKPTDKTDITPHTNHIYQPHGHQNRLKKKDKENAKETIIGGKVWTNQRTRRETEDASYSTYLLKLEALEVEKLRNAALAVFPNALAREGGVAHFYYRDSEEDDGSTSGASMRSSRDEVMGGMGSIESVGVTRGRRRKSSDVGWWHKAMQEHARKKQAATVSDVDMDADNAIEDDDEYYDNLDIDMPPPDPTWLTRGRPSLISSNDSDVFIEDLPQYNNMSSAARGPVDPNHGFRKLGLAAAVSDPFRRIGPSPPMLGAGLKFRTCPSPQHTVITNRVAPPAPLVCPDNMDDRPGTPPGLWRGTCLRTSSSDKTTYVPAGAPAYIATPMEPLSPHDPFAAAFGALASPTRASPSAPRDALFLANRARQEARNRKEARVQQEFDDLFVTQVFNYLSLGYPPTARVFDDELSKITGVKLEDLQTDDEKRMKECRTFDSEEHNFPESKRCARWKALKLYIFEWGRQCPDLDVYEPVAWAMRERTVKQYRQHSSGI